MPCAFENERVMNTPGSSIASGFTVVIAGS